MGRSVGGPPAGGLSAPHLARPALGAVSPPAGPVPPGMVPMPVGGMAGGVPEPAAAETTNPLPRVQAHQPEHLTVGLPLLDLLAPEQGQQPQEVYQPMHGQQYQPLAGYGALPPEAPQPVRQVRRPPSRPPLRKSTKLVIGVGTGVLLLAAVGVWALMSSPDDTTAQQGTSGTRQSSTVPQTSAVRAVDGFQFTQSAARTDTDCVANAYGEVSEFFKTRPCAALDRVLFLTTVDGRPTVVSLAMVRMPDEAGAEALKNLVDTNGTGNVNDLLKAGVQAPGGPREFSDAGYASARDGDTVVIAEADFADPAVKDQPTLDRLSQAALKLNG